MTESQGRTPAEWERIEREEHDKEYADSRPFDSPDYRIDPQRVIWWEDYCFKKGRRRDRGHRTKRVFDLIQLDSLPGKRILDVGCGNGQYSVFFAMLGAEAYGCDITPVGIDVANRIAATNGVTDRCRFSVQNAASLSYPDEHFDVVFLHEVLHHAIKYPGVVEEVRRVLKPGGMVVVAESVDGNPLFRLGRRISMRGKEALGDVVLDRRDIEAFGRNFRNPRVEMMSLFFMLKRPLKQYMDSGAVRGFLYLVKKLDDVLLTVLPPARRWCGEVVLVATK